MDTSTEAPRSGTILAGKYRLLSLLGRGGMGSVWRAEHLSLQAPVAVKMIDPQIAQAPEALSRFHREAQAAAALRSPNVVQILDHGVDETTHAPFIVMELMEGESLADRLARSGRLSPVDTSRIVLQMARALTRAHAAGIVHRDLKPDNVFLVKNEDEEVAKILDFGIAKSDVHRVGAATATGTVMGTAYYMSPEQISGSKVVDHRSDLWAVGVIAHECLTGNKPFESETLGGIVLKICTEPIRTPSLLGNVPAGFDQWFQRAVMRDPALRFQSARELADELTRVCESGAVAVGSLTANTLANSKTEWLDTGRVGLDRSGPVRADTGGALSRTAGSPAQAVPATRSSTPWLLAGIGVVVLAGAAAAYFAFGAPESASTDAAAAASSLLAETASVGPATTSVAIAVSVEPEPRVEPIPTTPAASFVEPAIDPSAPPTASAPAPVVIRRPRGETARPAPADPTPSPAKPKPSPFDGLLNSRK